MRIISGSARGTKLVTLEGLETRPTLDRVKESIFNILQFDIKDKNILDLFAGSGALGIEALSRGASNAVFCDVSKKAVKIISTNLENTKLKEKSQIINKDFKEALQYIKNITQKFDIIFLDPPYKTDFAEKSLQYILEYDLLSNQGIIILETDDKNKIENINKNLNIKIYDKRKYGRVHIAFMRKG